MKKFLPVILFLLSVMVFPRVVFADAMTDCLQANGDIYCNCKVNLGGTDQQCSQMEAAYNACLAKGNTPIECKAGAGQLYNQNKKIWFAPSLSDQGEALEDAVNSDSPTIADNTYSFRQQTLLPFNIAVQLVGNPYATKDSPLKVGAAQFFAGNIDFMIKTRPASTTDYIAYMGSRLKVPGTPDVAYAATGGQGFTSLAPILPIWTVMRNLAYMIFAIAFVIIGLMIMFRVKIDPKTAATIQNALPKIIIALLLVTFSYAIAGFLIDVMYVLLGLIVTIISTVSPEAKDAANNLLSGSLFRFVFDKDSFLGTSFSAAGAVRTIVEQLTGFKDQSGSIQGAIGTGTGDFFGIVGGVIAFFVIAIALIIAIFRTWLVLINAYAQIILAIILAPIQLALDAIPGQNQFSGWLKGLLSHIIVFPAVFIMIMLGQMIMASAKDQSGGFVPPLIGGSDFSSMTALIGLAIILTIPATLKIIQEAIKAPAFKYGSEWGTSARAGGQGALIAGKFADRKVSQWVPGYKGLKEGIKGQIGLGKV